MFNSSDSLGDWDFQLIQFPRGLANLFLSHYISFELLAGHVLELLAGHILKLLAGHFLSLLAGHVLTLLAGHVLTLLAGANLQTTCVGEECNLRPLCRRVV